MSILDELLDHLVAGDEEKAQKLFHEMIVTQSKIEWNIFHKLFYDYRN